MFILHLISWLQIATISTFWYITNDKPHFYRRLLQRLRQENILFTKIFQALSNSSSVELDPELRSELRPYTTNASYTEDEINYEAIDEAEERYGVHLDRHVANSGMIALIFNGVDLSGSPIILKLKRNNIYNRLSKGCDNVALFYRWATYWWPDNTIIRILRPFFHSINEILEQCDFGSEMQNMVNAHEDYDELGFIHIPTPLNSAVNNPEYILMNRIEGTHVLPPETAIEDRQALLYKFCLFMTFSYLSNGTQHMDLHSGNILFMPNGDLGIIDFGLAFRYNDDEHELILSICEMVNGATKSTAEVNYTELLSPLFYPPIKPEENTDPVRLNELFYNILRPLIERVNADELNVLDNLENIEHYINREIHLVPHFYKFMLTMMSMGQLYSIMGSNFTDSDMLLAIEKRALNEAFIRVM
jgi:predicted unusual protein kinase regulating ubiquinone biosynthesis (AarF/ABC1/UbiB family)